MSNGDDCIFFLNDRLLTKSAKFASSGSGGPLFDRKVFPTSKKQRYQTVKRVLK